VYSLDVWGGFIWPSDAYRLKLDGGEGSPLRHNKPFPGGMEVSADQEKVRKRLMVGIQLAMSWGKKSTAPQAEGGGPSRNNGRNLDGVKGKTPYTHGRGCSTARTTK